MFRLNLCWIVCWLSGMVLCSAWSDQPDFESQVAPVLVRRCLECHRSPDPAGGLLLTSEQGLRRGGDSGPAIELESGPDSLLLQRLRDGDMPPPRQGSSQRLPENERELLEQWISAGAPWPERRELDWFERTSEVRAGRDWWSLQPVVRPVIPKLAGRHPPSNPIDAFVIARLERQGMSLAPRADRRTLLRRLHSDLVGLPPSRAESGRFMSDGRPDAWRRAVDRLLASPMFGQRWARHWLDVARYADTSGYERDQEKPFAWKYRDWVVDAFNADMPYPQFIREQLAGDEIPDRNHSSVVATGFLRLGTWNDEPNDPLDYQYDRLEDAVHTTASAFLGLTVKCARCHPHKFDPIEQEDYYRMASAFWAGPIAARDRKWLGGPTPSEIGFEDVLAWTDLSPSPDPLRVLKNGERDHPLREVIPATMSMIPSLQREFDPPPAGARTSHRRMQLANWIADPLHPLTARVIVNRLWQHHFGEAIVRTPNNFGFLSDPPTHPQLLDWLAAELIKHGGNLKPIHRLILTSETWRQSTQHPQQSEFMARDPADRLWWRALRRRLDAESMRDSLLAVSGELDVRLGGESFKSTIPREALEGLSRKSAAWQASPKREQNRRSLYMFLKRGLLPPLMTTFDLGDPTSSCGQRDVTIVPTQALALLNNPFVHDRSRQLARRVLNEQPTAAAQVNEAFQSVLKRIPSQAEMEWSLQHLECQRAEFNARLGLLSQARQSQSPDPLSSRLRFHLRADHAVTSEGSRRVESIPDLSGEGHHLSQAVTDAQPTLDVQGLGQRPTLRFSGQGQFLEMRGQPLESPACTMICVASDAGSAGHRELISNWQAGHNVGSSLFLGLTAANQIRFSDQLPDGGQLRDPQRPFILTAINGEDHVAIYQNGKRLYRRAGELTGRRLDTPWVIGQQGNIQGEFWSGEIAEIRIYAGALDDGQRRQVEQELASRYRLTLDGSGESTRPSFTAETLALASLCQVLMNSNEFLFVD